MAQLNTVKIIKGVGPRISLKRLEKASASLLVSRVRGVEPQISFTFVQRLIDEVIEKRRKEIAEKKEIDEIIALMAEDPDLSDSDAELLLEAVNANAEDLEAPDAWVKPFNFEGLEITDLEKFGMSSHSSDINLESASIWRTESESRESRVEEEDDDDDDDDDEEELSPRKRKRVVACSRKRPNYLEAGVNVPRVLLLCFLAVAAMVAFVVYAG
jgi:hypothetical protein